MLENQGERLWTLETQGRKALITLLWHKMLQGLTQKSEFVMPLFRTLRHLGR